MDPDWIDLPGGGFLMGGGPRDEENPIHPVRLAPFRLARTPVLRADYQTFLDATGHPAPPFWGEPSFADPRMPAVGPSWDDAVAYCVWLGQQLGQPVRLPIRLPTEAEWEFAARAGRDVLYPWGDEPPESLPDYTVRWRNGPEVCDAYPSRHPLGFFGLGENVHEWCSDRYDAGYYAVSPVDDPQGPSSGTAGGRRSSRGGSWRHQIKGSRCAARSSIPAALRYADYGFRIASDKPAVTGGSSD